MNREDLIKLAELIIESCQAVRKEYFKRNGRIGNSELVWYMPQLFIEALTYYYYHTSRMDIRTDIRIQDISIKEGYEPRVVLTCTISMSFIEPSLTLKGEDLLVKNIREN